MSKKRKDFEIIFYEGLIGHQPNFFQALASLGDAYTRKGFYKEGLEVDKKLVQLRPEDPIVHYNLSCSLALLGDIEQAFTELKNAVLLGYDDFPYILKDTDLESVRKHPRFNEFFAKLERVKKN